MSCIKVSNIRIDSVSACVPKTITQNTDNRFKQFVGVWERRVADSNTCTSDLCLHAAEQLLQTSNTDRNEIGVVVFVSQTSDYRLPITSAILQHKLSLPTTCICIDIPLGCSGYTYGLYVVASLLKSSNIKYGLLLAGDTITKEVNPKDKSTNQLFGDAGTATLLTNDDSQNSSMTFNLGTDGSGFGSIIIPHGGARNPINDSSFEEYEEDGLTRRLCDLHLNGSDVYNFGTQRVSSLLNTFLDTQSDRSEIDYVILHQANKMMNDKIVKEIGFSNEKALSSLQYFGNTSSATIPLTMITQLKDKDYAKLLFSGFGVGLSWANVLIEQSSIRLCDLTQI